MIDETKTFELYGYTSDSLSKGSNKKIVVVCDKCDKEILRSFKIYNKSKYPNLCFTCANKCKLELPTPKFIKKEDRFIPNTTIDRILTIERFGYDPIDLKDGSSRKIIRICNKCGKYSETNFIDYNKSKYPNLCRFCAKGGELHPMFGKHLTEETKKKLSYPKSKEMKRKLSESATLRHQLSIPNHILEQDRFIPDTGIDRIKTIEQFGYDPIDLKDGSSRKIIAICQNCGISRDIIRNSYSNLCRSCNSQTEKTRISISAGLQKISIKNWDGFISDDKYCVKFNESLKTKIRSKYNNCDYISGLHKDICNDGRNLDVHHVDYNKQQGCDGNKWKLIPLSRVNHARTNANRPFWNRLFIYSLEYEKEYYGDK